MTLTDELALLAGIVDEIAYHTDLLASNAGPQTPETSDGGDAAAVHGQQRRTLARRALVAAKAARDTNGLIVSAARQFHGGTEPQTIIQATLTEIADQAAHMEALVARIAAPLDRQVAAALAD